MTHLTGRSILDIRSPSEYQEGHIPGAQSFPLFDDDERARIGTTHKQVGRQEAVVLGLEIAEKKANVLLSTASAFIYCWRGGMRSTALHLFLKAAGVQTETLPGGYKAFRKWVLETLEKPRRFKVLGGRTGVGKTEALKSYSEPVLDLEALAHHRGSSFGAYVTPQPSQEHFENLLAWKLAELGDGPIWVEDESRMIGKLKIPDPIWKQMQMSPLSLLESSLGERIARLVDEYGQIPKESLVKATERLEKKLGGERTRLAIAAIERGDYANAIREILPYYDRAYDKSIEHRQAG